MSSFKCLINHWTGIEQRKHNKYNIQTPLSDRLRLTSNIHISYKTGYNSYINWTFTPKSTIQSMLTVIHSYLHQFVPSSWNNDWIWSVWWEAHTWNPLRVSIFLDCVLADTKSVPQLDGLVPSSWYNLPIISRKGNTENILSVSNKTASCSSTTEHREYNVKIIKFLNFRQKWTCREFKSLQKGSPQSWREKIKPMQRFNTER